MKFTKMHGLGNHFMVIDAVRQDIHLTPDIIQALANPQTGVGFDQCLLIEPAQTEGIDFFYRIYNADGQEVGQCGNGARCVVKFIEHYGLSTKKTIRVETKTSTMLLELNSDDTVTVSMETPEFTPDKIPLNAMKQQDLYTLKLKNESTCELHAISVGNPHGIIRVPEVNKAAVDSLGEELSTHPAFPEQANISFMEVINSDRMLLRVYERGCGETAACGSAAVASAAIGMLHHGLNETVAVELPGGELMIHWPNKTGSIYFTGPATFVYEGQLLCTH